MVAHDSITDRESEPGALVARLRREEGVEHAAEDGRRNPRPVVLDDDPDPRVAVMVDLLCRQPDDLVLVVPWISGVESVARVREKVEEDLLDLLAAALDRRQVVRDVDVDPDSILA